MRYNGHMNTNHTSFDLLRLMTRVGDAMVDTDEGADEVFSYLVDCMNERGIPARLAKCEGSGSTATSGETYPFSFIDYCLVLDEAFYNYTGMTQKSAIEEIVGEQVMEEYANAKLDPGETWIRWNMDACFDGPTYLAASSKVILSRLVDEEVALAQHAQLDTKTSALRVGCGRARL